MIEVREKQQQQKISLAVESFTNFLWTVMSFIVFLLHNTSKQAGKATENWPIDAFVYQSHDPRRVGHSPSSLCNFHHEACY